MRRRCPVCGYPMPSIDKVYNLILFYCPDCGRDRIYNRETGNWGGSNVLETG